MSGLAKRSDAVEQLVEAIRATLDACDPPQEVAPGIFAGPNLPECLSLALGRVAVEAGGPEALVRHRPGCWEADHVRALAAPWVGWGDEAGS